MKNLIIWMIIGAILMLLAEILIHFFGDYVPFYYLAGAFNVIIYQLITHDSL